MTPFPHAAGPGPGDCRVFFAHAYDKRRQANGTFDHTRTGRRAWLPGQLDQVELYRVEGQQLELVNTALTNSDGRVDAPLLQGDDYRTGVYQLQFSAGDYYRAKGVKLPDAAFLDVVVLRFGIDEQQEHYHVPLLISPYSYSTYRGS